MKTGARAGRFEERVTTKTLTHDLSDGHRLSQHGGGTGPRHVVGAHTELQLVPGGEVPDDE